MSRIYATMPGRFWAKVDKSGECWEWTGAKDSNSGYGRILIEGRSAYAHRVAYEIQVGPIPEGMVIDHTCHVRHCVNLDHLRVVTPKQNAENRTACHPGNPSGARGVRWSKQSRKWCALVGHNGKKHYVGLFLTIAEAKAAVIAKRNELHTHNDIDRIVA